VCKNNGGEGRSLIFVDDSGPSLYFRTQKVEKSVSINIYAVSDSCCPYRVPLESRFASVPQPMTKCSMVGAPGRYPTHARQTGLRAGDIKPAFRESFPSRAGALCARICSEIPLRGHAYVPSAEPPMTRCNRAHIVGEPTTHDRESPQNRSSELGCSGGSSRLLR
jgi:hypothetical protein